ncbi:hypothetical protein EDB85DRAFT_941785 [Lactarius pseudohatsudake]|nr:hypothetical protein EDB85DRAFT_941785 [Lactarius pseudohatsudake]
MHFMTTLTNIFIVFIVALMSLVAAAPLAVRDVYVPPITYPHDGTVWTIGSVHNVTWDNSNPPQQITNPNGVIMLRKGDRTTDIVLASDFKVVTGRVTVKVPNVQPGSNYSLVLFGDSGNFSPQFTIKE